MSVHDRLIESGISKERVEKMIHNEPWGGLVDAYGVLNVLSAVVADWPTPENVEGPT